MGSNAASQTGFIRCTKAVRFELIQQLILLTVGTELPIRLHEAVVSGSISRTELDELGALEVF
jgi:RNase P/RNase MRP subunit POP5